jgi:ribosomal protein L37AE/L43A
MLYGIDCDCGMEIDARRVAIGYFVCLDCGDKQAKAKKFVVQIPYGKGAYQYIHNPMEDLKYTNPKRTT